MNNTALKLNDPEFIEKMDFLINETITHNLEKEAENIVSTIEAIFRQNKGLEKINPEVYKRYKRYLIKARFVAIPRLKRSDILHLLEFYFTDIFSLELFDLYEKIKKKLINLQDLKDRDDFKVNIKSILLRNKDRITKEKIKTGGTEYSPTISNWLKDYTANLGNKPVDKLKLTQYFTRNDNVKKLSDKEKRNIKILFNFYEQLKIPSSQYEGLEESFVAVLPNGEVNLVYGGAMHKIDPEIERLVSSASKTEKEKGRIDKNKLEELRKILPNYPEGSLEYKAIKEEIERLEKMEILDSYPKDSLEHKVIEEEIGKSEVRSEK